MKTLKLTGAWILALLAPVLMWTAVRFEHILPGIAGILAVYLAVFLLPWARTRENLWIFLIGAAALLPLNIWLSGLFFQIFPEPVWVLRVLRRLLIGVLLFCTEEVMMASGARILWKKQRSTSFEA